MKQAFQETWTELEEPKLFSFRNLIEIILTAFISFIIGNLLPEKEDYEKAIALEVGKAHFAAKKFHLHRKFAAKNVFLHRKNYFEYGNLHLATSGMA